MSKPFPFTISGLSEVVFVVADIEKSLAFYHNVIGWQVISHIESTHCLSEFWQLPPSTLIKNCLVRAPNASFGGIRLIQILGIEQEYIRPNSQIWDVGGIFDINVRVKNIHQLAKKLHQYQWFGVNQPVTMTFGRFTVYEWLAKSHDGITHALIERIEPPLEDDQQTALFSAVINASMIVENHQQETAFLTDILGFTTLIHQASSFEEETTNVFGMPHELVKSTPQVLTLLSPDGSRDGTVEIASFPELTGNNYAENAKPFNIGITALRFPVNNLSAFIRHLKHHELAFTLQQHVDISPYGNVDIIAVNSPAGNRLEFFEGVNN